MTQRGFEALNLKIMVHIPLPPALARPIFVRHLYQGHFITPWQQSAGLKRALRSHVLRHVTVTWSFDGEKGILKCYCPSTELCWSMTASNFHVMTGSVIKTMLDPEISLEINAAMSTINDIII